MLAYPVTAKEPDNPFRLLQDEGFKILIAQSGLLSEQGAPLHHATYNVEKTDYRLENNQNELKIPLRWESEDGIQVVKTYTFKRDSYLVDVEHQVLIA